MYVENIKSFGKEFIHFSDSFNKRRFSLFTDRECPELPSPTFGQVTLRGLLFNDKANYTCELGYTLVGPKQRLCQADGTWSGSFPICKQNGISLFSIGLFTR